MGSANSLGFLAGGGINATALREGDDIISLVVEDKTTHKVIGQAQKYIKVLRETQIYLPTLIHQRTEKT